VQRSFGCDQTGQRGSVTNRVLAFKPEPKADLVKTNLARRQGSAEAIKKAGKLLPW
jgi:hypothetical protein